MYIVSIDVCSIIAVFQGENDQYFETSDSPAKLTVSAALTDNEVPGS